MKKTLFFMAALMAVNLSYAEGFIREIAPDLAVTHISPNGRYVVSQVYGYVEIFDLHKGTKSDYYGDEDKGIEYTFGQGNAIADTGTGVGSTTVLGNACVWENDVWTPLPVLHSDMTNSAQGITPDARRICGQVGNAPMLPDTEEVMSLPCIWDRNEDGTYVGPIMLPHPDLDLTGRVPQYITAIAISEDGHTIAGQVRDYSGMLVQPILYREDEKGDWSYEMLFPDLANPDGIVFPPFPGEAPQDAPDMRNYLSLSELAAYEAAVEQWELSGGTDWSTYPDMEDFMTPEELAAFNAAVADYNKRVAEWEKLYLPYQEALNQLVETATVYLFNNVYLSPDGRMYGTTTIESVEDPASWTGFGTLYQPAIMDVVKEEFTALPFAEGMITTCVTADYSVLANTDGVVNPKQAYIAPKGDENWIGLDKWLDSVDPEVGKWFREAASHDVEVIVDGVLEVEADYLCSGVAVCTPDMSLFATFSELLWDSPTATITESYIFSVNPENSVGDIDLDGKEIARVNLYSLDGQLLQEVPDSGIVIRSVLYKDGSVKTSKIAF